MSPIDLQVIAIIVMQVFLTYRVENAMSFSRGTVGEITENLENTKDAVNVSSQTHNYKLEKILKELKISNKLNRKILAKTSKSLDCVVGTVESTTHENIINTHIEDTEILKASLHRLSEEILTYQEIIKRQDEELKKKDIDAKLKLVTDEVKPEQEKPDLVKMEEVIKETLEEKENVVSKPEPEQEKLDEKGRKTIDGAAVLRKWNSNTGVTKA